MTRWFAVEIGALVLGAALVAGGLQARQAASAGSGAAPRQPGPGPMPHGGMRHGPTPTPREASAPAGLPALPGQDAFGAIAEIVRILEADPLTDWTRVDLERLRQHLIDMREVVLRAQVKTSPLPGGLVMDVTGEGRTEQAIRAMVVPHAAELDRMPGLAAAPVPIPGGVRLTVTARNAEDARAVARVRGLGFFGLLTLGAHHQSHHLALARGDAMPGHRH